MTAGTSGTSPELLSSDCAPPAPITPGRSAPGTGTARSRAPAATITQCACTTRATPSRKTPSSKGAVLSARRATAPTSHTGVCGE